MLFIDDRLDSKYSKVKLIVIGLFLVALSFVVVTLTSWLGILIVGMFLMTVGEMIAFPFSNAFAVERAKKGNQGEYGILYDWHHCGYPHLAVLSVSGDQVLVELHESSVVPHIHADVARHTAPKS